MSVSSKLDLIFDQAQEIAAASKTHFSSVHILLSYFVVDSPARHILNRLNIHEERLLKAIKELGREPDHIVDSITEHAWQLLNRSGGHQLDSVWYLKALVTLEDSLAFQLLERCHINQKEILEACWICSRAQHLDHFSEEEKTTEARITEALGSLEMEEAIMAIPRSFEARRSAHRETVSDGSERRSRSPGRRRSDRLDGAGSRRDRQPRANQSTNPFSLDPQRCPTLCKLGVNLTEKVARGEFDPIIGREAEVDEIIDILGKKRSNNPLLIGPSGVGKTALVEGVVHHLVQRERELPSQKPRVIVQLDVGALLAGTHLRGALAERLRNLQQEVKQADGQVVVFIDELHSLFGNQTDGGSDAANELKLALSRGDFPCLGTTTIEEYRQHIESDAALARRFSNVVVDEPSSDETKLIVAGLLNSYETHHQVVYADEAVNAAIRLGKRYLHEQRDPDRTLSVLDWAGAIAKRSGGEVVLSTIQQVISKSARIPIEHLTLDASERFLAIENTLESKVLGQPHVAKVIGDTLIRNLAGFSGARPIGSMLFIGPTGVGKTEVVKTLAELVFGSSEALTRFDMSEFSEGHTVARLIGSPPGYVGHQEGGQLTEAVLRRPYQVILLDEIEKAHRDIWNLLLQVTDEGHLSDSKGRRVDFSNTMLIMTSNLGAHLMKPGRRGVGFAGVQVADEAQTETRVLNFAKDALPLEFWNRIDARIVFNRLDKETIVDIASQLIDKSRQQIRAERNVEYRVSPKAITWIVDHGGYDLELGARPLRSALAKWVELPISEAILKGDLKEGQIMDIDLAENQLTYCATLPIDPSNTEPMEILPPV